MRLVILSIFMLLSIISFSQKIQLITDGDKAIEAAVSELDQALLAPEGALYQFALENQISGSYIFDLSIRKKGEVATVFVVNSNEDNLRKQNLLKDWLKAYRFHFKMPKGKIHKFQYTLNL